ncbi:hypothetical protein L596_011693 [Steinernema carpocapsae]|uniref:Amine oxidase domain-containing protein n=1 Tax=Steinernema carpocapsae TaxID=34508 RepID=A0A4U5NVN1_STECR|nr:hypothetical protein L596_011693 [Steinernema carpocapsae]
MTAVGCADVRKRPLRLVVIGSGPTAIGAIHQVFKHVREGRIQEDDVEVTVLEKESEVGGLARSVTDSNGFTWDLGVHVTGASKYPEFTKVFESTSTKWNYIKRIVKADMKHVLTSEDPTLNYIPYPVQQFVHCLPEKIRQKCNGDLKIIDPTRAAKNFDEFTFNSFGPTMQEIFIRPYNEKVWTVALNEMNCDWVVGRVPKPTFSEEKPTPISVFRYPADTKGIGEVWKRIAENFPSDVFHFNEEVIRIDRDSKMITTKSQEYPFDAVLSTIPIVSLGKMCRLDSPINLKYSKVLLVGIGLKYPQSDWAANVSWTYFPRPETIFYRCTFISNFNVHMTPDADEYWSVLCEIGLKADEEFDEREVIDRTTEDLQENGIIESKSLVVNEWLHVLPFGYPIPTLNREEELARTQKIFEQSGIYSRGRFGGWRYECANQDHSFTVGQQFVDYLFFKTPENVHLV